MQSTIKGKNIWNVTTMLHVVRKLGATIGMANRPGLYPVGLSTILVTVTWNLKKPPRLSAPLLIS
jgi:hypothetical protein